MTEEQNAKQETVSEEDQHKQVSINSQYIKDLSFENPKAPHSIAGSTKRPDIQIGVDVNANMVQDDLYEVVVSLRAKASTKIDDKESTIFIAELLYGGLFTVKNISDQEREGTLLVFCPTILFPFARRVIADVTRDGGFPPLMLDPIDFASLYQQKLAAMKEQKSSEDSN